MQPLATSTPRAWLAERLARWSEALGPPLPEHRTVTLGEAVALLPELHARRVAEGTPRKAAAKYLAAWFGGLACQAVGHAALGSGAGFVVDRAEVRWRVHPGGWADAITLGDAVALVDRDHPWSGRPGTETVEEPLARAAAAAAEAMRPLVETLRGLSGLGRPGLWAEVGDGFGGPLAFQSDLPVTEEGLALLRAMAGAPGTPWKRRSALWAAEADHGTVCVQRKGGCCLAYTEPGDKCANCALRDPASCEAEQISWHNAQSAL